MIKPKNSLNPKIFGDTFRGPTGGFTKIFAHRRGMTFFQGVDLVFELRGYQGDGFWDPKIDQF